MSKTLILAISGGIDSVVLLDIMSKLPEADMVVAHFDHGIREDSADDERFVKGLAEKYGLDFRSKREELGENASEERARKSRYAFLHDLAEELNGKIVTAHHGDDALETVAINHSRGTGWRGLAVMDSEVVRPLLSMSKDSIRQYAFDHELEWHEDSTNQSDKYLRNRLRRKLSKVPDAHKQEILSLRRRQLALKKQIDVLTKELIKQGPEYDRSFFMDMPRKVAIELIRAITKGQLTGPQMGRALLAIQTFRSGATLQAGQGVEFRFTSRHFVVELIK